MTQTYTPTAPATSATFRSLRRALVAVWAVFAVGAVAFVAVIGTNAPYADEWEFVPALVGEEPALPWLWQQHNEHRLPLPRAVYLTLFALTHDFRAGMLRAREIDVLQRCSGREQVGQHRYARQSFERGGANEPEGGFSGDGAHAVPALPQLRNRLASLEAGDGAREDEEDVRAGHCR